MSDETVIATPEVASVPPAIAELFKLMPPAGADWPAYQRVAFLQALEATFQVVYGGKQKGTVNIVVARPSYCRGWP